MEASSQLFRYTILILAGLCTFGTNVPKDGLTALQVVITRSPNCTSTLVSEGADCCQDCIGMGDFNYNTMFSIIFATNIFAPICAGFLLDKLGNSVIVVILICACCGSSLISFGATISHSPLFLPCMFVGSAFFGLSFLSSLTSRDRIILTWFAEKETGFALGIAVTINRFISLGVFSLSMKIRESVGLQWTLWVMASVSLLALICSICVSLLDIWGTRQLRLSDSVQNERRSVQMSDVCEFGVRYWVVLGIVTATMGGGNILIDNGTEYVFEKYHLTKQMASVIGGSVRYIGLITAPLAGIVVDVTGRPSHCLLVFSFLLIIPTILLSYTMVHPAVTVPVVGGVYCLQYVVAFASVNRFVQKANLGTALALFFVFEAIIMTVLHFVTGEILGSEKSVPRSIKLARWRTVMTIVLATFVIAACLSVVNFFLTLRQEKSKASDKKEAEYQELQADSDIDEK